MKTRIQKRNVRVEGRYWLATAIALAFAASASAQQAATNVTISLAPLPGVSGTATFATLGWEKESLFAKVPAAPSDAKEYILLHRLADNPTNALWSQALAQLAEKGDAFTLGALERVKKQMEGSAKLSMVDGAMAKIQTRLAKTGTNPAPADLVARLERAALADVVCSPLESTLVPWAMASVRPQINRPEVKSTVEKLAASKLTEEEARGLNGAFRSRVANYAARLLGR
jgi:hypothetical protein